MTVIPDTAPPGRAAFTVVPVIEYEPPLRELASGTPRSPTAQQRGGTHPPRHRRGSHPSPSQAATPPALPTQEAAAFANAALRRVLEVIDRRRPATALRSLLAPSLIDSVVSLSRMAGGYPPGGQEAGVLRRVRLQAVGRDSPYVAAEAFGTYTRGQRSHAVACRVEQLPAPGGIHWQMVALHLG